MKSAATIQHLQKRQKKLSHHVEVWNKKLQSHQQARLVTALLFLASLVPPAMNRQAQWEYVICAALLLVFIILVIRTRSLKEHARRLSKWHAFTLRQEKRCLGLPSGRPWKHLEDIEGDFALIRDLGLTGSHSLWTLLDETMTEGGQRRLLSWMSTAPLNKDFLKRRQDRIKSLRRQTWFYTRLGLEIKEEEFNVSSLHIRDFLKEPFVGPGFNKVFVANIILWVILAGLFIATKTMGITIPSPVFMIFPLVSWLSLGTTVAAFNRGVGLSHHLSMLGPIFGSIEARATKDKHLAGICAEILQEAPSKHVKKLEFILSFVGTQTNPLLHFLLNAILPWTQVSVFALERLRQKVSLGFPKCIEELSELEVLGSLLILDKYQTQTYPEFADTTTLQCQQVYHPLLERSRAVANDFSFPSQQSLGLLTGSNMSGKSTFLRTIGVNQILANMGAPVFAEKFVTVPLKIETCIEVSDSLRDGYSYFYAEVRRLRDILKVAATGSPVLFLIDEIFRGTNNRERQLGSRAVIKTLAQQPTAIGFISTHDLELTNLEKAHPSLINLHFREDINDRGEMIFSYQLKHGPCPTTNALRIMKAEGINVEDI